MRRKDKELCDKAEVTKILRSAALCRIALNDGDYPYIVPLNYGFIWDKELTLYFHSAAEGKKLRLMRKDPHAGFEIDIPGKLIKGDKACGWVMRYRSIVGKGDIELISGDEEKREALNRLMEHYAYKGTPVYDETALNNVIVYKLNVKELSAKGTRDRGAE